MIWIVYCCLVLCVMESISVEIESTTASIDDYCQEIKCVGVEYSCRNRKCYCAEGYVPNYSHAKCIKCPELGESCDGKCCSNTSGNETLTCWQGVCQQCHDNNGNWMCGERKESSLISNTKIAIDTAAMFVFVVSFILVLKLCAPKNFRPIGSTPSHNPRLSIGSMELYIEERLRDAPPKYSMATPSDASHPFTILYLNNGYVHDSSMPPPPPYTPGDITEDRRNAILHI